ncbi:hypothetical protein AB205_0097250 [Aquarana catesbeiana]|uniref:Uncharacterized protein n=1 Tax=Aquarana catesbeiana TaxID=8400 RepID=A0A2G9QAI9_AQUCT|nr:hypothetical protein AB205_0097250 [Aquarana catesbeiana]
MWHGKHSCQSQWHCDHSCRKLLATGNSYSATSHQG